MDTIIETIEHKGYTIKIFADYYAESPRTWDNLGTMVCFHNRYDFGDETEHRSQDFTSWKDLKKTLAKNAAVILPIYMYDHSGQTVSTTPFSCPWDSGQIGYIYVDKQKAREAMQVKRLTKKTIEHVKKLLESEVKTYDVWISGSVLGYEIIDNQNDEQIDSCWGYYSEEDLIEDAKNIIKNIQIAVESELYVDKYGENWTVKDKKNPYGNYTLSSNKKRAEANRKYLLDNPARLSYYRKNEH